MDHLHFYEEINKPDALPAKVEEFFCKAMQNIGWDFENILKKIYTHVKADQSGDDHLICITIRYKIRKNDDVIVRNAEFIGRVSGVAMLTVRDQYAVSKIFLQEAEMGVRGAINVMLGDFGTSYNAELDRVMKNKSYMMEKDFKVQNYGILSSCQFPDKNQKPHKKLTFHRKPKWK